MKEAPGDAEETAEKPAEDTEKPVDAGDVELTEQVAEAGEEAAAEEAAADE